ncbi:NADH-quinone oxidoreductase subunit J [Methylocystis parvus]|uniref:NADH-quinone oxidoreductase subunit J n=1 Tax=Methylocystis parvus TaxID=134 RepID=UPI003C79383B
MREFLAMLLVVVYVGAVSVLFLFVVMMLDVDFAELKAGFIKNAGVGALVGGVVLAEILALVGYRGLTAASTLNVAAPVPPDRRQRHQHRRSRRVLYTKYVIFFQAAALVLLTAMIGAIVLTLHHRPNVKRQNIKPRTRADAQTVVEIKKVPSGGSVIPPTVKHPEAAE